MEVQANLAKVDVFKFELSITKMFLFTLVRQLDNQMIQIFADATLKQEEDKEDRGHGSPGELDQDGPVQVQAEHPQDVPLHPCQTIR